MNQPANQPANQAVNQAVNQPVNQAAGKHRVLFVDDEPNVTIGIRRNLRRAPFEIYTANSPYEALELLETTPVDVIVSDERMPEMLGSELLAIVRRDYPDTERVILTGEASVSSAIDAINQADVFRFLVKPCNPNDLAFCVNQALETLEHKRAIRRSLSQASSPPAAETNSRLERAMDSAYMAFQPILCSYPDRKLFGFEALLRTRDESIDSPSTLLKLAEDADRVCEVEGAIRGMIAEHISDLPEDAVLLMNVHPQSLSDEQLYADHNPLRAHSSKVVLEIIERSALQDTAELREKIDLLRAQGFRIAVDDLGAGYSGLTSFALLVPEIVKFDIDLIKGIHESPTRSKLISSLTTLCREMGIQTIAEGVELEAEHEHVIGLNCDLLQGFLYGSAHTDLQYPT